MEWLLVSKWSGYKWKEFLELDGEEQSFLVAGYRCFQQMESVVAHEQNRKLKTGSRNPGGKRRR